MTRATKRPVLLTGFDPFDGAASNPSWQAVDTLSGRTIAGHAIETRELPTEFRTSLRELRAAIARTEPSLVICVGLAGGRAKIGLERVAINVDDARIADNAGARPIDKPVIRGAPAAYFSTLPIKAMLAGLLDAGIAAEISQTAGTFVCNHVFFGLMHELTRHAGVRGGFVHVPFTPELAKRHGAAPSMPVDTVASALERMIEVALRTTRDRKLGAGATH